jgi:uncharacterized repeat protein (TIGR01451 family)
MLPRPILALLFVCVVLPVHADTFTLVSSGNWSSTAIWNQNGGPASRSPGSAAGTFDTVTMNLPGFDVDVDVALVEGVALSALCPGGTCTVDVTSGTLKLTGGGTLGGAATINIASSGTLELIGSTSIGSGGGSPAVNNAGTVRKEISWDVVPIAVPFHNSGTVSITAGMIEFLAGGTHTGQFLLAAPEGPELAFDGAHTFLPPSSLSGTGSISVTGTATLQGICNVDVLNVAGTVQLDGATPVAVKALGLFPLGRLEGTANVVVSGPLLSYWSSGDVAGSGTVTFQSGSELELWAPTNPIVISGRQVVLNGDAVVFGSANAIELQNGASITNNGNLDIDGIAEFAAGAGGGSFVNNGAFTITNGIPPWSVDTTNTGLADFIGGGLDSTAHYVQTGGETRLGYLASPFPIRIEGGSLTGNGFIAGHLVNDSVVVPTGAIGIEGDYTQTSSGTLEIELRGADQPHDYDRIDLSGTATLGGTIDVTLIDGYIPENGDVFRIIGDAFGNYSDEARTGTFATENLPAGLESRYLPNAYELRASPPKFANLSVTQTNSGTLANGQTATFTVAVHNAGPDAADGVILTAVTNGTVISANPAQGSCGGTNPITCQLGTLASGVTIAVTVQVRANASGALSHNVAVGSSAQDAFPSNNTDSSTLLVTAAADVSITISGPATAQGGELVTYTTVITNHGPDAAANVTVNNPLPPHLSFNTNSGGCTTAFPCSLGTLNASATTTITSLYVVNGSISGNVITNAATVSSPTFDPNSANNSAAAVTAGSCAGFTPSNLSPNGGNAPRAGKLSWDYVPGALYEVFLGPAGQGCSTFAGTSTDGELFYSGLNDGAYEWRVQATFGACETVSSACTTFNVAQSDLDFAISLVAGGVPIPGGEIVVAMVVDANFHMSEQPAFVARLTVPQGLEPMGSCNDGQSHYDPATRVITWNGRLDNPVLAQQSCPLWFRTGPSLPPGSSFTLNATLTMSTADANTSNNSATHTAAVAAAADLIVESTADVQRFKPGTNITYSIRVANTGPNDAPDVTIVDDLSAHETFLSFEQLSGPAMVLDASTDRTIRRRIPLLPAGGEATFRLVTRATPATGAADLFNRVTVASAILDLADGNNEKVVFTQAGPNADLASTSRRMESSSTELVPITISISNDGPDTVNNVVVHNAIIENGGQYDLVENVHYVSATPSQGTCSAPEIRQVFATPMPPPYWSLDCTLGTFAPGGKATIAILIEREPRSGSFRHTSFASPAQNDPNRANNGSHIDVSASRTRAVRK